MGIYRSFKEFDLVSKSVLAPLIKDSGSFEPSVENHPIGEGGLQPYDHLRNRQVRTESLHEYRTAVQMRTDYRHMGHRHAVPELRTICPRVPTASRNTAEHLFSISVGFENNANACFRWR